ncbi:hypothetical protein V5O48_008225 [Marasmius crinis-equi]|uniref:Fe2OG dioxygenase domain-containing protein n=1 Tax=Marasmius crinis-equi TaxID=585013 RepID=A0ABR3FEQ7_9AGAR
MVRRKIMLAVMHELTEKLDWEKKVFDESFVVKWKAEALAGEDPGFSENMFDDVCVFSFTPPDPLPTTHGSPQSLKCIRELCEKATHFSQAGRVFFLDTEAAVLKSDSAIPSSLTEELKAVKTLEDVPDRQKDWHPGTDGKVFGPGTPGTDWADAGLQVIDKLADMELRPEEGKTEYSGGTWHVEGQHNEHSCASAIYYYDQSNVTDSRLAFRQLTHHDDFTFKAHDQNDYGGVKEIYGVQNEGPCVQELSSVLTREGRLLAFPNVLQHRVSPFRLVDPTKPGHRKILALFLVDPYTRTLSAANITPQQHDWWAEVTCEGVDTKLRKLPLEVFGHVVDVMEDGDWPLSLEELKRLREDLMSQRRVFVDMVNSDWEQSDWSFCEH